MACFRRYNEGEKIICAGDICMYFVFMGLIDRMMCLGAVCLLTLCSVSCRPSDGGGGVSSEDGQMEDGKPRVIFKIAVVSPNGWDHVWPETLTQEGETLKRHLALEGMTDVTMKFNPDHNVIAVGMPGEDVQEMGTVLEKAVKNADIRSMAVHQDNSKLLEQGAREMTDWEWCDFTFTTDVGEKVSEKILISVKPVFSVTEIERITREPVRGGLELNLNAEGASRLEAHTKSLKLGSDRMAFIVAGKIKSAPYVQSTLNRAVYLSGYKSDVDLEREKEKFDAGVYRHKLVILDEPEETPAR